MPSSEKPNASYEKYGMVRNDTVSYSLHQLLAKLLDLGRSGCFEAAGHLSRHAILTGNSSRQQILQFTAKLTSEELKALIKAIAKFEDGTGGGGSVSMNHYLLLLNPMVDRATFDWVLRNCRWYYSKGAKSLDEYEQILLREELHRDEMEAHKIEMHLEAFRRKAKAATDSLCGAIRRKDAKAIASLLKNGADGEVFCPDGNTVQSFVEATANEELRRILEELSSFQVLMSELTKIGREGCYSDAIALGARYRSEQTKGLSILIENPGAGFRDELSPEDFEARAKALAMFEMGYGWRGSKSFVALLAYRSQGDNRLFGWVLQNTSGWHYAKGKKLLEEFEAAISKPKCNSD